MVGWRALVADAELRTLLGRVAVRAMRAPDSLEWFKAQLGRLLDEDEGCEAATPGAPQTRPARHEPDAQDRGRRIRGR